MACGLTPERLGLEALIVDPKRLLKEKGLL